MGIGDGLVMQEGLMHEIQLDALHKDLKENVLNGSRTGQYLYEELNKLMS